MDIKNIFAANDAAAVVRFCAYRPEAQRMLFLPEYKSFLDAFVRYGHEFCAQNVADFIKIATPEQLKFYFSMCYILDEEAQKEFVKRREWEVWADFLESDDLNDEAEVFLLETYSGEDLYRYLRMAAVSSGLSKEGEMKLFAMGNKDAIAAYVFAGGEFYPFGQRALVRLGIQELTDAYFIQHAPCREAAELLDAKA